MINKDTIIIDNRDTVTSTNDLLIDLAKQGTPEGYVIAARAQTAGKGRKGRAFYSKGKHSIYMSILLRPNLSAKDSLIITPMAAVAVNRAIVKVCDKKPAIKWVNDIFVDEKKVCGILTEADIVVDRESSFYGKLSYVVVGIGINVFPFDNLPDNLIDIAGSIYSKADMESIDEEKAEWIRDSIINSVVDEFINIYNDILARDFMHEYRENSMCIGKVVDYIEGGVVAGQIEILDVDDDGRLIALKDGKREVLDSGEISIKMK